MRNTLLITLSLILTLHSYENLGQQPLTAEMLEKSAFRFALNDEGYFDDVSKKKWIDWIGDRQFMGLAELHYSSQLSYFTKALLPVLDEKGFEHFALEMGPNTTEILRSKLQEPEKTLETVRQLNRTYGKKSRSNTPLIFLHRKEDAVFLEEAIKLDYELWGLDQEFAGSYEMLIDGLYNNYRNKSESFQDAYLEAKSAIRKVIFKRKYKDQPVYCWYPTNEAINNFFAFFNDEKSQLIINDIRESWDIYCKSATGHASNQQRADYMKKNFDNYLSQHGSESKVFLKFGNAHLTHGISPFGVNDIGKYLTEMTQSEEDEILIIRYLVPYRNGRSNLGKSGWKLVDMLLEPGVKDQWTVIDLRSFRKMLANGEITTNKKYTYELNSYDLLLLPPNDTSPKVNY